jgi:aspartyl-tRNA synthetase
MFNCSQDLCRDGIPSSILGPSLLFVLFRDTSGTVQLICDDLELISRFKNLTNESVISVVGEIRYRPDFQHNKVSKIEAR